MSFLRFFRSTTPEVLLGGRYKVIRQLGAGGFGQTFLAEDLHLPGHPHCVIKRLQPQFSDANALLTAKRLFDTEAQVLYKLGIHDQIPRLLAHFEHEQEFYLAQELILGESLSRELKGDRTWTEGQVVALLQDMLSVLAFVHQQGVIHRDIKPANLIRRHPDGKIVLIDFGAVKQASLQLTTPISDLSRTISIGTQGYMPSEQIAGNPRFSSDIYAVGKIGIQALTGIAPRYLEDDPLTGEIQWQSHAPQVTPALADFLSTMIRYDFRARYTSAAEALEALVQLPIVPEAPATQFTSTTTSTLYTTTPWAGHPVPPTQPNAPGIDATALTATPQPAPPPETSMPPASAIGSQTPTHQVGRTPDSQPSGSVTPSNLKLRQTRLAQLQRARRRRLLLSVAGLAAVGIAVVVLKNVLPRPAATPAASTQEVASSPTPKPDPKAQAASMLTQADQLRKQSQFLKAIELYKQASALDPKLAEAQWGRCYSLNRIKMAAEALTACSAALAINPNYPDALWSKGYALELQKRYDDAIPLYERAIALRPNFAEAWNNKGTALLELQRPKEALTAFNKATELNPKLAAAWSNRGAALWGLRRYDEALKSVDRALQLQPNLADAISLREQMRQRLGR